jgi:hypothetical protein
VFTENLALYLEDFGVEATWYGAPWALDRSGGVSLDSTKFGPNGLQQQTALVIRDEPDEIELGSRVLSRANQILFPTTQFVGIKNADAVVIGTDQFSVLEVKSLDDGAFMMAALQQVKLP